MTAPYHALITAFHDGSSRIAKDRQSVQNKLELLKLEYDEEGETQQYPEDIQQAIEAALCAIEDADNLKGEWDRYEEMISTRLTQVVNHPPGRESTDDGTPILPLGMNQPENISNRKSSQFVQTTVDQPDEGPQESDNSKIEHLLQTIGNKLNNMQTQMSNQYEGLQTRIDGMEERMSLLDERWDMTSNAGNNSVDFPDQGHPNLRNADIPGQNEAPAIFSRRSQTTQAVLRNVREHTSHQHISMSDHGERHQPLEELTRNRHVHTTRWPSTGLQSQSVTNALPRNMPTYNQSPLPPLKAHAFDGKRIKYEKFKIVFHITIGSNPTIHNVQKLLYLIDLLPTQDKTTVDQYPLSNEGYELAWTYLDRKYGNSNNVMEDLLAQLKHLKVENNSVKANKNMWLTAQSFVSQLEMNGLMEPRWMIELILNKFSPGIRRSIYKKFTNNTTMSWTEFRDVTDGAITKVEILETRDQLYNYVPPEEEYNKHERFQVQSPKQRMKTMKCIYCESIEHYSSECPVIPLPKRKELLKKNGRCENCSRKGHTQHQCTSTISCTKCKGKHHRSLPCASQLSSRPSPNKYSPAQNGQKVSSPQHGSPVVTRTNVIQINKEVSDHTDRSSSMHFTMPILLVKVEGRSELVPVFLDCGAQVSLIDDSLARELKLEVGQATTLRLQGFHSEGTVKVVSNTVQLNLEGPSKFKLPVQMYSIAHPVGETEVSTVSEEDHVFMKKNNIQPPRKGMSRHVRPTILLGMDVLWKVLQDMKTFQLPSGNVLLRTKLGSVIIGPTGLNNINTSDSGRVKVTRQCHLLVNQREEFSRITHDKDDNIWCASHNDDTYMVTEELQPDYVEREETNQKVLNNFNESIEKRNDGYYVVLPVKENIHELKNNYWVAITRLRQFVAYTMKRQPEVFQEYVDAIQLLMDHNFIEEAPSDPNMGSSETMQTTDTAYFLPHQGVRSPGKPLRIVFDASSHAKNEVSLNDMLNTGPLLLQPLLNILCSTRFNRYMITSDIEKAFLNVHLKAESRDLVRFLWLREPAKGFSETNIMIFRFTRVPFGLSCSPFLLNATILYHLKQLSTPLAERVLRGLYVDNLIITTQDQNEIQELYQEIKDMFNVLHMNMRAFLVNEQEEFEKFSESDQGVWKIQKILGIKYDPETDEYIHDIKINDYPVVSKRVIAHCVASTFDPTGFLAPLILPLKVIQQRVTKEQYAWDTPLSVEHSSEWNRTVKEVNEFEKRLPRMVATLDSPIHIVACCDASKLAIAATIHVVQSNVCHIVMAKSRIINPGKIVMINPSIPKLELAAMTLAVTLLKDYVATTINHQVSIDKLTLLTDSMVALQWIRQGPSKTKSPFAKNRIKEISMNMSHILANIRMAQPDQTSSHAVHIGHIPSEMNPSDCATRGLSKQEFQDHLWWTGAPFFVRKYTEWPVSPDPWNPVSMNNIIVPSSEVNRIWTYTNNLSKLVRTVAYMFKFVYILKTRVARRHARVSTSHQEPSTNLTVTDLEQASKTLIRIHQKEEDDLEAVREKNMNLNAFKDDEGIWRCQGRLQYSHDLTDDQKHPILIAPKSRMAELIIRDSHGKYHRGTNHTMSVVRQRYWIPRLRSQVNAITRSCITCQKISNSPQAYPEMAALPARRISRSFPFEDIGIDFFGPIPIVEEGVRQKSYGFIVTCLTTRLIHLEVLKDMSCTSMLLAMRRFFGRRGVPRSITSDNSPTFHLAERMMEDWFQPHQEQEFLSFLTNHKIKFCYITQYSPWKGGVYERLIGSVKRAFVKSGFAKIGLTREELETIFCEMEGQINSRPLTQPESQWVPELKERMIIRPIDFLNTHFEVIVPSQSENEDDDYHSTTEHQGMAVRRSTQLALQSSLNASKHLCSRWTSEYLTNLRETHVIRMKEQGRVRRQNLRIGQVVLLTDDIVPRGMWKLAVITTLNLSDDGQCREVELKSSANRIIRRPPNKIVPLELDISLSNTVIPNNPTDSAPIVKHKYQTRFTKKQTDPNQAQINSMMICYRNPQYTEEELLEEAPMHPEGSEAIMTTPLNFDMDMVSNISSMIENSVSKAKYEIIKSFNEIGQKITDNIIDHIKCMTHEPHTKSEIKGHPDKKTNDGEHLRKRIAELEEEFESLRDTPTRDIGWRLPKGQKAECAFCSDKDHISDLCSNRPRIGSRRTVCTAKGLCKICLNTHNKNQCPAWNTSCRYCGEKNHNHALCLKPQRIVDIKQDAAKALMALNIYNDEHGLPNYKSTAFCTDEIENENRQDKASPGKASRREPPHQRYAKDHRYRST